MMDVRAPVGRRRWASGHTNVAGLCVLLLAVACTTVSPGTPPSQQASPIPSARAEPLPPSPIGEGPEGSGAVSESDVDCSTASDCQWVNVRIEDDGTCCRYRCHETPASRTVAKQANAECRARPEAELSAPRGATSEACVRRKCNKPPPLECLDGRCVRAMAPG
ncbi:MAG: hypothetical protein ACRBN8_30765 [Nannocystales bacterium]